MRFVVYFEVINVEELSYPMQKLIEIGFYSIKAPSKIKLNGIRRIPAFLVN